MRNLIAAILVLVAGSAFAQQQRTVAPAAFFGVFSGGGVAESEDSAYFGTTARDLDVTIRAEGNGFSVAWTSVIRQGGDPNKPNVRRKVTTRVFQPLAGRPGLYRAADSGDPIAGQEMSWARIRGATLTVYLMGIDPDGTYELQRYDRTVGPGGMQLTFTRERDGEKVRKVTGRMVKQAN
ncbi:MAG TPA: hypothetical protein VIM38_09100 [Alphaproteobacteria bacterium]